MRRTSISLKADGFNAFSHVVQPTDPDRWFWFPDDENVWLLGERVGQVGEVMQLMYHGNTLDMEVSKTHHFDPSHYEYLEDIAKMNNLHEAPLLDLLHRRYSPNDIYTFTADILISLNPYVEEGAARGSEGQRGEEGRRDSDDRDHD